MLQEWELRAKIYGVKTLPLAEDTMTDNPTTAPRPLRQILPWAPEGVRPS